MSQNNKYMSKSLKKKGAPIIRMSQHCKSDLLPIGKYSFAKTLSDQGVFHSGISYLKDSYRIKYENPTRHYIVYTFGGKGWLRMLGKETPLGNKTIFIGTANIPHERYLGSSKWEKLWFIVETNSALAALLENIGPGVFAVESGNKLLRVMELYVKECQYQKSESNTALFHLSELISIYLRKLVLEIKDQPSQHQYKKIFDAFIQVGRQLNFPWTNQELAAQVGYTPNHFSKLCLQFFNMTPGQKILDLRMKRAAEMLSTSNMNLFQIGTLVGYSDPFSFSKAFKRWGGKSPMNYKKLNFT